MTDILRSDIVALAKQGVPPREIVMRLPNVSVHVVYGLLAAARKRGERIPMFPRGRGPVPGGMVVRIEDDVLAYLRAAGARRNLTAAGLLAELAEVIARDKLAAAILDDGASDA